MDRVDARREAESDWLDACDQTDAAIHEDDEALPEPPPPPDARRPGVRGGALGGGRPAAGGQGAVAPAVASVDSGRGQPAVRLPGSVAGPAREGVGGGRSASRPTGCRMRSASCRGRVPRRSPQPWWTPAIGGTFATSAACRSRRRRRLGACATGRRSTRCSRRLGPIRCCCPPPRRCSAGCRTSGTRSTAWTGRRRPWRCGMSMRACAIRTAPRWSSAPGRASGRAWASRSWTRAARTSGRGSSGRGRSPRCTTRWVWIRCGTRCRLPRWRRCSRPAGRSPRASARWAGPARVAIGPPARCKGASRRCGAWTRGWWPARPPWRA